MRSDGKRRTRAVASERRAVPRGGEPLPFVPIIGAVIGARYTLIEEVARGGMGSVWRAEHSGLGAHCAIKFMVAGFASDAETRGRFLREARAAAQLQGPNVVRVFDVDEWQGALYMAMELLDGETLADRLERGGPLDAKLTCDIVEQVARALTRAHAARLVHRDLKPENVFLVRREPFEPQLVKVLDFGVAKQLDAAPNQATKSGALLGTAEYMSPEQALGSRSVDERSDLWSLAVVAYHCVTGKQPFRAPGFAGVLLQITQGLLPVPSHDNPVISAAFDAWWLRTAQRDAARRPRSAAELARELREALGCARAAVPPRRSRAAPPRK
jgi:eukaryotic-like serine/threonine-protein kinase